MEFGETLSRLRKIYGYSGSQFSSEIGIARSYLSEIENNKKKPSYDLLDKIARTLDIKTSTFVLLSESDEEMKTKKRSEKFIRQWYIDTISKMSDGLER